MTLWRPALISRAVSGLNKFSDSECSHDPIGPAVVGSGTLKGCQHSLRCSPVVSNMWYDSTLLMGTMQLSPSGLHTQEETSSGLEVPNHATESHSSPLETVSDQLVAETVLRLRL